MITQHRFLVALAAGASLSVLAAANASATPADDAQRDARIARLEAAVAALQGEAVQNRTLKSENAELQHEVGDLQTQVADLKASTVQQIDDVRQTADNQPKVSFPGGRPTFATADGQFTAALRGQLQLDTAAYFQPSAGPIATDLRRAGPALGASATNVDLTHARDLKDGVDWRRARIGIEGTAYGDWDYRLLFDFGGSGVENAGQLYEAWGQYSGFRPLHLRVGAWPQPIGLEDQASTNYQLFLERPAISDVARNLAAGDTRIGAGAFAYDNLWFVSGDVTGRTIGVVNTGTFITSTHRQRRHGADLRRPTRLRRPRRGDAVPWLGLAREHRRPRQLRRPAGQYDRTRRRRYAAGQRHGGAPEGYPGAARRRDPTDRHRFDPGP